MGLVLLFRKRFVNESLFLVHTTKGDIMHILITGATSGIGYRVAEALLERGHFVYLTTHTEKESQNLREKFKEEKAISIFKLDITNPKDYEKASTLSIDVLICHASLGVGGSLIDLDVTKIKENYDVNVFGNLSFIQKMIPILLARKGRLIVTSSIASIIPIPFLGSYTSTKASLSMLMKVLRMELKLLEKPISVSLIEPGIYNTGFNDVMIDEIAFYSKQHKKKLTKFQRLEKQIFKMMGKDSYKSIVKKFIKAVEASHPRKVYRAPFTSRIFTKIYLLLFG